jgi:glucose-1-phosphate thymidylyltransferase
VYIEDGVRIERSVIGPNVSIERGSVITDSHVSHTLIGSQCTLAGARLTNSLIGSFAVVRDAAGEASLGDHAEWVGVAE